MHINRYTLECVFRMDYKSKSSFITIISYKKRRIENPAKQVAPYDLFPCINRSWCKINTQSKQSKNQYYCGKT